jgi:hypothetical protein
VTVSVFLNFRRKGLLDWIPAPQLQRFIQGSHACLLNIFLSSSPPWPSTNSQPHRTYLSTPNLLSKDHWFWRPNVWKGDENLRHIYKKTVVRNIKYSSCLYFWLLFHSETLLWDENFFSLTMSNGISKNPSFYTDFRNVHLTLVKSVPKIDISGTWLTFQLAIQFFG